MSFRIGQKVICIDDRGDKDGRSEIFPVKGSVYTIRAFHPEGDSILLEEIVNEPREYWQRFGELYFMLRRFRPLIERKTDIGFAHEILKKTTRKRSVDA